MEQANQHLGTERIGRLMKQYAIPCIISLLVGALYNIVDQIFIANASYLGSYGNAANTVVFPLTIVALAIAVMIGDGCCAFVSISLGKEDTKTARSSVGNSVLMTVVSGLVLTAVYLIFSDSISLCLSAVGLLLTFLIVVYFSRRIVRPFAESYEKQKQFPKSTHPGKRADSSPSRQFPSAAAACRWITPDRK